jgi:hypothetical protein
MAFDKLVADFARSLARQVADQFEAAIGDELQSRTGSISRKVGRPKGSKSKPGPKPGAAKAKKVHKGKGIKRNMDCRVCGKRSGGPGSRYMCEEHEKLPKKEQDAALEKWRESHKA